jgi:hypothetical protein
MDSNRRMNRAPIVGLARISLETRELARTAADISARTRLEHLDAKSSDSITGVY